MIKWYKRLFGLVRFFLLFLPKYNEEHFIHISEISFESTYKTSKKKKHHYVVVEQSADFERNIVPQMELMETLLQFVFFNNNNSLFSF